MQTKSMLATMMMAVASVVMLFAMGSSTAYASFVSPIPGLPGSTPAGFSNFEHALKAHVSEKRQKGFKPKAWGTGGGNYLTLPGLEKLKMKWGDYKDVDWRSFLRDRYKKADRRSSVATVPVPAAVWLFGSGLLGLVSVARRKAS